MIYRLGIDLGGTNIAVGIVDETYNIIAKSSAKTNAPCQAEKLLDSIVKVCLETVDKAGIIGASFLDKLN
jgi:glucokinase